MVQLLTYSLRFAFTARDTVRFPSGKPGNILRGALGTIFRKIACAPDCPGAKACEHRHACSYARIFEPTAIGSGPSGLADWPRPFTFRAGHLDGTTVHPNDSFHFDLNVFELDPAAISDFVRVFSQLAHEGLGPHRGRADLISVAQLDAAGDGVGVIYDGSDGEPRQPSAPLALELSPGSDEIPRIRVRFVSPTELKAGKRLVDKPDFRVLFSRARDRVSTLRSLYQGGPLEVDFRAIGRRADDVAMTRCEVQWRDVMRHSSKTGQTHPLGGFVGVAEYEGDLTEFYPYLFAAQWTGIGRHTVWGKGAIEVQKLETAVSGQAGT